MIIFECKQCQKQARKTRAWIKKFGLFCSVNCSQKNYEDEMLQEELQSSNPELEGLLDAVECLS